MGETIVQQLRREQKLTQDRLAQKSAVPQPRISEWETGRRGMSEGNMEKLAGALGVDALELTAAEGITKSKETLTSASLADRLRAAAEFEEIAEEMRSAGKSQEMISLVEAFVQELLGGNGDDAATKEAAPRENGRDPYGRRVVEKSARPERDHFGRRIRGRRAHPAAH